MSEPDFSLDFLDQEVTIDSSWSNKRSAVRYLRNDIRAAVKVKSIWFPRLFPVVLRDVSSRGAAIFSEKKLGKNKRIFLYLLFSDGTRFDIAALVVHCDRENGRYGIKFDNIEKHLAEHLLHTQTDLLFS
ncbi:PilZ domain-containing protein [Methylomonas rosea]|uniref:PilZ domain-containing protein n=1 Tax=Methylomonas rosea TaxID=2952227 RepID=A0ABT1TQQ3_9GAMM|nr:PilZ domain-containing protein [Methylomonas sp. WSC-7]MCQ8117109.1 PilZ domain-containing protein [Methylomonas sp. WSC-7]